MAAISTLLNVGRLSAAWSLIIEAGLVSPESDSSETTGKL
jgi:hypothetical protein